MVSGETSAVCSNGDNYTGIGIIGLVMVIIFLVGFSNVEGYGVPNVVQIEQPTKWMVGVENEISVRVVTYWTNFNGTMIVTPTEGTILLVIVGDPETNMITWEDWGVTDVDGYLNYTLAIDKAGVYKTLIIENVFGEKQRWSTTFVVIE